MKVLMESGRLCCQILNKNGMTRDFFAKTRKTHIHVTAAVLDLLHENGLSDMKRRSQKAHSISCLPRTHLNSHTDEVSCSRLLLPERQSDFYVECVTVQHIYCTNAEQTLQSETELQL